ncbi:hypothetical protein K458DRAFT_392881 [Lentithecium fluviatile CBS 122367]|uniref:Uncharacterized protein n=1 Tax=Lentithecium fluviatile CBS 122367 TaxID=1168545 RepID=A0A6G1IQV5_9PLEO|nr:hypothetical protein K458DRAFT_392881 [Lentithecium fluviatile CBS 122367]
MADWEIFIIVEFSSTNDCITFEREGPIFLCVIGKLDLLNILDIKGSDIFAGARWDSARWDSAQWDHSVDLKG